MKGFDLNHIIFIFSLYNWFTASNWIIFAVVVRKQRLNGYDKKLI